MKFKQVTMSVACIALSLSLSAAAESNGTESELPDPRVLASGIIIDCGQWPPAKEAELGGDFRHKCEKNSRLIGYKNGWVVKMENIPDQVKEHRRSLSCPEVAEQHVGYACIGKPGR